MDDGRRHLADLLVHFRSGALMIGRARWFLGDAGRKPLRRRWVVRQRLLLSSLLPGLVQLVLRSPAQVRLPAMLGQQGAAVGGGKGAGGRRRAGAPARVAPAATPSTELRLLAGLGPGRAEQRFPGGFDVAPVGPDSCRDDDSSGSAGSAIAIAGQGAQAGHGGGRRSTAQSRPACPVGLLLAIRPPPAEDIRSPDGFPGVALVPLRHVELLERALDAELVLGHLPLSALFQLVLRDLTAREKSGHGMSLETCLAVAGAKKSPLHARRRDTTNKT